MNSQEKKLLEIVASSIENRKNLNDSMNAIIKEISQYTGWPYGEVWLPDADGKQMIFSGEWNTNYNLFEDFRRFSSLHKFAKGVGLVGRVWQAEKGLWDKVLSISSDFLRYDVSNKTGIKSGMGFYVKINDDLEAVIAFFQLSENPGDQKYFQMIESLTSEIAYLLNQKINLIN